MEKYIKLENLGNGANSDVILVKNIQDLRLYALKRIFMEKDEKENKKIQNEISILETLDHPNVVKYSESFCNNNKYCIVMEYADKGDLSNLIKKHKKSGNPIKEDFIWNLFFQLTDSLKYIHSKKIIHRDIKSQNIFLAKNDLIKLGDFGVSKALENTGDFAKSFLGTPYFLSPEICAGKTYDYKSDLWMLGCVLYECCSLKKPFSGDTFHALMNNIMKKNQEDIPENYSDDLKFVVNSLLEKDPNIRPKLDVLLNFNEETRQRYKNHLELRKKKYPISSISERDKRSISSNHINEELVLMQKKSNQFFPINGTKLPFDIINKGYKSALSIKNANLEMSPIAFKLKHEDSNKEIVTTQTNSNISLVEDSNQFNLNYINLSEKKGTKNFHQLKDSHSYKASLSNSDIKQVTKYVHFGSNCKPKKTIIKEFCDENSMHSKKNIIRNEENDKNNENENTGNQMNLNFISRQKSIEGNIQTPTEKRKTSHNQEKLNKLVIEAIGEELMKKFEKIIDLSSFEKYQDSISKNNQKTIELLRDKYKKVVITIQNYFNSLNEYQINNHNLNGGCVAIFELNNSNKSIEGQKHKKNKSMI